MITFAIIGFVIGAFLEYKAHKDSFELLPCVSSALLGALVLVYVASVVSTFRVPEGYKFLDEDFYYINEDGGIKLLFGDVYSDGEHFYERDITSGLHLWIPFAHTNWEKIEWERVFPVKCPNCGRLNTSEFCVDCGTSTKDEITCPVCGALVSTKFCGDCGSQVR